MKLKIKLKILKYDLKNMKLLILFLALFDVPEIIFSPDITTAKTGDSINITCSTNIRKPGQLATSYTLYQDNIIVTENAKTMVSPLQTKHNGSYHCQVTVDGLSKNSTSKTLDGI